MLQNEDNRPQTKQKNLIVVLDMDETLLHAPMRSDKMFQKEEAEREDVLKDGLVMDVDLSVSETKTLESHLSFNFRPHLKEFLQHVTSKYETYIFTASGKDRADQFVDHIEDLFDIRFAGTFCGARPSLVRLLRLGAAKSLTIEFASDHKKIDRMVLVDNDPIAFLINPDNGILVNSFYDNPQDNTLPKVAAILDELQSALYNGAPGITIQDILRDRFGLEKALRQLLQKEREGTCEDRQNALDKWATAEENPKRGQETEHT